jgi:hypothetical protein
MLDLSEHDFYDADKLAAAIEPPAAVPIAAIVRKRD